MNFANLGFDTSIIIKVGDDIYAKSILEELNKSAIKTSCIIQNSSLDTGFSIILVSFEGDRTVLANRGANGLISEEDINYEELKTADWLYIAPLNGESNKVLKPLVTFAHDNNVKVCFNAGTTSIKQGFEYIKSILEVADVVVLNKEEAMLATGIQVRPDTKSEHFSEDIVHKDIQDMLQTLKNKDYQVIVITDGGNGAYCYDGKNYYFCPVFDSAVVSTLGAGDAFASTFFASIKENDFDLGKALMYASVQSSAVVSVFGATEGLISFSEIKKRLQEKPLYNYIKV